MVVIKRKGTHVTLKKVHATLKKMLTIIISTLPQKHVLIILSKYSE